MRPARVHAAAFVEAYGRTWEAWDVAGFVDLFSEDVVYVVSRRGDRQWQGCARHVCPQGGGFAR